MEPARPKPRDLIDAAVAKLISILTDPTESSDNARKAAEIVLDHLDSLLSLESVIPGQASKPVPLAMSITGLDELKDQDEEPAA